MTLDINTSIATTNTEIAAITPSDDVAYTFSLSKNYQFQGDVLQSVDINAVINLTANTLDITALGLPWGATNIAWLSPDYKFQSYDIKENFGAAAKTFTTWTENYLKSTSIQADSIFDVQEDVVMPTWNLAFWYDNNPKLGSGDPDTATDTRLRQVFGLRPIQGTITASSLTDFSHDPYTFLSSTFATFDGIITRASIDEVVEDGLKIYKLTINWTKGGVGTLPTYSI